MGRPGTKAKRLAEPAPVSREPAPHHGTMTTVEAEYIRNTPFARRRKFGQFFTPETVAALMCDWILEKNPKTVLDPAVGCGVFLRTALKSSAKKIRFDCYDIDENIIGYIGQPHRRMAEFHVRDFLRAEVSKKYDAAILNPPYLRHHDMNYPHDIHEEISSLVGSPISKTANAYVMFVMKTCHHLKEGGRGVFIIPTEWSNANFGASFKDYLINKAGLRGIIYFSNCSEIFEDALTTSCILLVEKGAAPLKNIPVTYVEGASAGSIFSSVAKMKAHYKTTQIDARTLASPAKWDYLIKNGKQLDLAGFINLSDIAQTKRGIATGANDFFHVSNAVVQDLGIRQNNVIDCIGKAADVKGILFSDSDLAKLVKEGRKTSLIALDGELNKAEKNYVAYGQSIGLHERYLLSKRSPWYSMESRLPAPIWAAVFGREGLRFIYNEAGISNLTTFHGIYPHRQDKTFLRALTVVLNSRIVQERARAHIRVYGGGLLKFEPRDLLEIQIPDMRAISDATLKRLATCLPSSSKGSMDDNKVDDLVRHATAEAASKALPSRSAKPPSGRT